MVESGGILKSHAHEATLLDTKGVQVVCLHKNLIRICLPLIIEYLSKPPFSTRVPWPLGVHSGFFRGVLAKCINIAPICPELVHKPENGSSLPICYKKPQVFIVQHHNLRHHEGQLTATQQACQIGKNKVIRPRTFLFAPSLPLSVSNGVTLAE